MLSVTYKTISYMEMLVTNIVTTDFDWLKVVAGKALHLK